MLYVVMSILEDGTIVHFHVSSVAMMIKNLDVGFDSPAKKRN